MAVLSNFVRRDGVIGGVAGGLAYSLDIPVFFVRLGLILSVFLGLPLLAYVAAVFAFPTKEYASAYPDSPKVFGVCYRLAPKVGISASWLRFFILLSIIPTGFFPVPVIYFAIHLLTGEERGSNRFTGNRNFRDVN